MSYLAIPAMKMGAAFACGFYAQYQTQSLYEYGKCQFYGTSYPASWDNKKVVRCIECSTKKDIVINSILSVALSALFGYFGFSRSKQIGSIAPITALCLGVLRIRNSKPHNIGVITTNTENIKYLASHPSLDYIFTCFPYLGSRQPQ